MTRALRFEGSAGRTIRADLHQAAPDAPLVLVAHGFKGFRNWGFFARICESLVAAGLSALRFDFSHNGVEERDFDRLDLFLLDTFSRHQEDLRAIVDGLDDGPLGLFGHSRGGTDALLYAACDPRIRAVATLAAVADTCRAPEDAESELRSKGFYPIMNARTGQLMPVARTAFEDANRHDVVTAARRLAPRPLLLVHGTADESVPLADAQTLADAHGQARLAPIEGGGHTLGAVHPFAGDTAHLVAALEAVGSFFTDSLAP